jgi:hypothetical protein
VLDFDEKVKKGQGNITLSQAGNSENISVNSEQVSIAGSKATIAPAKDFAYNSPVTVAIAAGVFQDEQGNPLPQAVTDVQNRRNYRQQCPYRCGSFSG